jgi:Fe-S-cluster containining protein
LRYENVEFPDGIGFKCKQCGACCRFIPGDANKDEQKQIEEKGFKDFSEDPDITGRRQFRRNSTGGCFFLTAENTCKIHNIKPMICRIPPFRVVDWDYEKNLIFVEPRIDFTCPGVIPSSETPSPEIARAAQLFVKDELELTAKVEGLPITSRRVAHLTRLRIINYLFKKQ